MKYRREVDGLRAVAILPVILFHAGFGAFKGGFVGVDVFFVISGYLITTIILSDLDEGRFSIRAFYERRIRRILPVLFFVMICCFPFAWLWLPPDHLKYFCKSLVAVPLFSSNVLFWKESGYFGTSVELKPLLHTWSLAVEEQYYLFFPPFLMLLWKVMRNWIFGTLIFMAFVSLGLSQVCFHIDPSANFYLFPTRAWELLIGGIVAYYLLYLRENRGSPAIKPLVGEFLGFAGLALIAYAIFFFDKNTPWPGVCALVPTLGTALVIVFSSKDSIVGRMLGAKMLVGVGLISYSAYLWHQPVFAFARHRNLIRLTAGQLLVLAVLSLVLAYFSWRYIENPFRKKGNVSRRKVFAYAAFASVFFLVVGFSGYLNAGYPERFGFPESLMASFRLPRPVRGHFVEKNVRKIDGKYYGFYELGKKNIKPSFVVFGDSHARSMFGAFDEASNDLGLAGTFVGANACVPFLKIHSLRTDQKYNDCYKLNNRVLDYVVSNNIGDIYLVSRWTYYTDGGYYGDNFSYIGVEKDSEKSLEESRKAFEVGLSNTVAEYKKYGVNIHVVLQVPQQRIEPKIAYKRAYYFNTDQVVTYLNKIAVTVSDHERLSSYVRAVFNNDKYVQVVSFDDILCNETFCPIGERQYSFYYDDDHLSKLGAKRLVPAIERLLDENVGARSAYDFAGR